MTGRISFGQPELRPTFNQTLEKGKTRIVFFGLNKCGEMTKQLYVFKKWGCTLRTPSTPIKGKGSYESMNLI